MTALEEAQAAGPLRSGPNLATTRRTCASSSTEEPVVTALTLYDRIREQFCPFSGLSERQLDKHARLIADTVHHARTRNQARSHHRQGKRDQAQTKGR